MSGKTDFTSDEWTQVVKAPGWASLAIVAASPSGPIGIIKELFAAGKVLGEAKRQGANNGLVDALVMELGTSEGRHMAEPTDVKGKSPAEARAAALDALRQVARLVDAKGGTDAMGFKQFLGSVAQRTAEASKEGGLLGIGGTRVSDEETRTLGDVKGALGVA